MINSQINDIRFQNMVHIYSRRLILTAFALFLSSVVAVVVLVSVPAWNEQRQLALYNRTIDKSFPFNSWYPFNKKEPPFYQVASALESFRGLGVLGIITGNDCLFMFILFFTFGQYSALRESFQNIFEDAKKNVEETWPADNTEESSNRDEVFEKRLVEEANKILKKNIKKHIELNK